MYCVMKMCFLIQEKQQIDVGTENAAFEADEGLKKSDNPCPKYQVSTFKYFEFFAELFFSHQNTKQHFQYSKYANL